MATASLIAFLLFASTEVSIPTGTPVELDGEIGEGEWKDAYRVEREGTTAWFKREGRWLMIGLRGSAAYAGETFRLRVREGPGAFESLIVGAIGRPSLPPAFRYRGSPQGV
ncbi:MAG: hypothetical protein AAGD14_15140, partial [Planctomycetota bacterium]